MGQCIDTEDQVKNPEEALNTRQLQVIPVKIQPTIKEKDQESNSPCFPKIKAYCFNNIEALTSDYYISEGESITLELGIEKYKKICRLPKHDHANIQKGIKQLAHDNLRLSTQVHQKHVGILKIMEKLFGDKFNLNNLKCDGKDMKQVCQVADVVKQACEQDLNAFTFLSFYIKKCAQSLSSNDKKSVNQVTEAITNILQMLKQKHPPNEEKPQGEGVNKIQSKAVASFKKMLIDFKNLDEKAKIKKLNQFIMQVSKVAYDNLGGLISVTKQACMNNDGLQFKTCVKVKDQQSKGSIERVKEKLLSKQFKKFQIRRDHQNLNEFLQEQKEYYQEQLAKLIQEFQEEIQFTVSDMLRGKCMFRQISNINQAANQIISECERNSLKIIEINNRLGKATTDLVFKIEISDIVTQFQLAYKFNVVKYEFNHKLYQLVRSKFFTVLQTLEVFNYRNLNNIIEYMHIMNACSKFKQDIRVNIGDRQRPSISRLKSQFQKWVKQNIGNLQQLQSNNQSNNQKQMVKKLKSIYAQQSVDNQQIINFRTALYLYHNQQLQMAKKKIEEIKDPLNGQHNSTPKNIDSQGQEVIKLKCDIYQELGLLTDAKSVWTNYLKYLQTKPNEKEEKFIKVYDQLGSINWKLGMYEQSLGNHQKSLQLKYKIQKDSLECAQTFHNIGLVFYKQGNYAKSQQFFQKSLNIIQKKKGKDSIDCTNNLNSIGNLFYSKGDYTRALQKYQESIVITEKVKGKNSKDCAQILNRMGNVFNRKGDIDRSLKYYEESMNIIQKVKGQDSLEYADILNYIGNAFNRKGDSDKALKYYKRSLDIKLKVKGVESIDYADTLHNIGATYCIQKDYQKALKYCEQSLKIKQKVKGSDSIDCADTLNNIGNVFCSNNYFNKGKSYYEKSLIIRQNIKGEDSIDCADTLNNIGNSLCSQGQFESALDYFERSLAITQNVKGQGSIDCAATFNNMGIAYKGIEDYEMALDYYQKSMNIVQKYIGKESLDYAITLNSMGRVNYKKGVYENAIKNFEESLQIKKNIKGQNSVQSADTMNNIGNVFFKKGEFLKAKDQYMKAREALQKIPNGKRHPNHARYAYNERLAIEKMKSQI